MELVSARTTYLNFLPYFIVNWYLKGFITWPKNLLEMAHYLWKHSVVTHLLLYHKMDTKYSPLNNHLQKHAEF